MAVRRLDVAASSANKSTLSESKFQSPCRGHQNSQTTDMPPSNNRPAPDPDRPIKWVVGVPVVVTLRIFSRPSLRDLYQGHPRVVR